MPRPSLTTQKKAWLLTYADHAKKPMQTVVEQDVRAFPMTTLPILRTPIPVTTYLCARRGMPRLAHHG